MMNLSTRPACVRVIRRCCVVVAVGVVSSTTALPYVTAGKPEPEIDVRLEAPRDLYHPGEVVRLRGILKNVSGKQQAFSKYALSTSGLPGPVTLVVRTPDGHVYECIASQKYNAELLNLTSPELEVRLDVSEQRNIFDYWFYLRNGRSEFSSDDEASPPNFRQTGIYRAWFIYSISVDQSFPGGGWCGIVQSSVVEWSVSLLQPEQTLQEPTPQQLEAVGRLIASGAAFKIEDQEFVRDELLKAENEGLARHVLELHRTGRGLHLDQLLRQRACVPSDWGGVAMAGIDGPYLKSAAMSALEDNEAIAAGVHGPTNSVRMLPKEMVTAYMLLHPDDELSRERWVKLARRGCRIQTKTDQAGHVWARGEGPLGVPAAWSILMDLGVLHAGMTALAAVEILGPPMPHESPHTEHHAPTAQEPQPAFEIHDGTLRWHLTSPRHVNPGLTAVIRDGKVVKFRFRRG